MLIHVVKASSKELNLRLRDELATLNNEIDTMELDKRYGDEDEYISIDEEDYIPDTRRLRVAGVKQEWKYQSSETQGSEDNPDKRIEGLDLPLLREGSEHEWSYRRIRDLIALLHVGLFEYADRLSAYIAYSISFKKKFLKCSKKLSVVEQELKNIMQDKVKLQELLNDLGVKYNMLTHALKKAEDINHDNKQTIEKIRVNRDKCIQTVENRVDVIASLRNQNTELRRHLATLRSKLG